MSGHNSDPSDQESGGLLAGVSDDMLKPKIKIKFPIPAPAPLPRGGGARPGAPPRTVSFSNVAPPPARMPRKSGPKPAQPAGDTETEPAYLQQEKEPASEEQFLLRLPADSPVLAKLREDVESRAVPDVSINFTDGRHATFTAYGQEFTSTLMDLPAVVESQRSIDNRRFVKVADISQMLVVDGPEGRAGAEMFDRHYAGRGGAHTAEQYMYPDGITPPLHQVRKRRFRKRLSKQTIEQVEEQVERLLMADALADEVVYEILDVQDHSDDEHSGLDEPVFEADDTGGPRTPGSADGRKGGTGTARPPSGLGYGGSDEDEDEDEDDQDVEAKIAQGFAELKEMDDDDDGRSQDSDEMTDDGEGSEEEEDEDEEDEEDGNADEVSVKRRALLQEMSSLNESVKRKEVDLASATNPIVRRRFEDIVGRLRAEYASKKAQLEELTAHAPKDTE